MSDLEPGWGPLYDESGLRWREDANLTGEGFDACELVLEFDGPVIHVPVGFDFMAELDALPDEEPESSQGPAPLPPRAV